MKKLIALALCLSIGAAHAQMSGGAMFPGPGNNSAVAPSCANDGPDGTMDFNKCSNIAITAALW